MDTQRHGDGLRWNTGGWFGGQIGGTLWMLISALVLWSADAPVALLALALSRGSVCEPQPAKIPAATSNTHGSDHDLTLFCDDISPTFPVESPFRIIHSNAKGVNTGKLNRNHLDPVAN